LSVDGTLLVVHQISLSLVLKLKLSDSLAKFRDRSIKFRGLFLRPLDFLREIKYFSSTRSEAGLELLEIFVASVDLTVELGRSRDDLC